MKRPLGSWFITTPIPLLYMTTKHGELQEFIFIHQLHKLGELQEFIYLIATTLVDTTLHDY